MVKIVFELDKLRAAAYDGDKLVGDATFVNEGSVWKLDHTNVDVAYGGQGIAAKLVACVVENARASEVKIEPVCSYAVKAFEKNPEYKDVQAQ